MNDIDNSDKTNSGFYNIITFYGGAFMMMEETLQYFGLKEDPFDNNPEKLELYCPGLLNEEHYSYFVNLIKEGESDLYVLSGDKGTGKTSMLLLLQRQLISEGYAVVYLKNIYSSYKKLVAAIVKKLNKIDTHGSKALYAFLDILKVSAGNNQKTVIIIDNANHYGLNLLEHFYVLFTHTNDRSYRKSFNNILIYGGDGLCDRSRIIKKMGVEYSTYNLLFHDEITSYIENRFKAVGDNSKLADLLLPYSDHIHCLSMGYPQKINKICSDIFDIAARKNQKQITPDIIDKIIKDNGYNEGINWLDRKKNIKLKTPDNISSIYDQYFDVKYTKNEISQTEVTEKQ